MTELVIIAAIARNNTIGATIDGKATMPWRLPEDLKHFKALTLGHPIIMGRKTWESLGRPLPGRQNIVITRNGGYLADGATVVNSLDAAIALCDKATAFVIGGGEIYAQALSVATRLEFTEIDADFAGDTQFPAWDRQNFIETTRETHRAEAGFDYAFVTYRRAPTKSSQ
jgi:dihydrofolate reductase